MYQSLYRMELSGPQAQNQQNQQQGQGLPMQRPESVPQGGGPQMAPPTNARPEMPQEEFTSDIDQRAANSMRNKIEKVGKNRFTSHMQQRTASMATNLRKMVESGKVTQEEAKQILADAVGSEFRDVNGWMEGKPAPQDYSQTANPTLAKKFLEENLQTFEELRELKTDIASREEKLRTVYDKKNPQFAKSSQDLVAMKQKYEQMFQAVRMKMYGSEGFEGDKMMRQQRGEEVI